MSNWGTVALENIADELKNIREILEKQLEQSSRVGERNELVRCKDCRHNPKYTNNYMYGICPCCCEDDYYSRTPDDDFYCGYGERIDNE